LDFARASEVFAGLHATRATHGGPKAETRFVSAGFLDERLVVLVWTPRGDARHIISMRHAHAKEQRLWKSEWKDSDDAPELTKEFFRPADIYKGGKLLRRGRPPAGDRPKEAVKLRISPDVLDYFRAGGPGWQTRINTTLERAVSREKRKTRI
jgi:uncharacterized protein (DUF4415 family)